VTDLERARGAMTPSLLLPVQGIPPKIFFKVKASRTAIWLLKDSRCVIGKVRRTGTPGE